ncbi:MAG: metallophosphoesterase, partial [Mycoplasmataceae bacterium]|nr:metallophosphoesterase [Mycoplasmataceae bacterium]
NAHGATDITGNFLICKGPPNEAPFRVFFYVENINLDELLNLKVNFENSFHIKTLLLGDSGVGKTTLGYWLENQSHDETIHSTHGMRFFEYQVKEPLPVKTSQSEKTAKHKFTFDIWDFGGQPEYQISHKQNFDETRLIFLVVDVNRKDNSEYFWINSIKEHLGKMKKDITVFIIGTKSKSKEDEKKLQKIEKLIKSSIPLIKTKTILHNTAEQSKKEDKENPKLISEMETFIKETFKIEHVHILTSYGYLALQEIKKLQKERFHFTSLTELLENINDNNISEIHVLSAITSLQKDGSIEMKDNTIILKPYWKNILATAILLHVQKNETVKASISLNDLFSYNFEVKFDKLFEIEEKNKTFKCDMEIYNTEFKNASSDTRKSIAKELVQNFINDKICYYKNGMLVFPSRFHYKKDLFDKKEYFALESLSLVSQKQVEVTIGVIVTSLEYSNQYEIIKHLNKGVKVKDKKDNLYLIEFSREDIDTHHKNQHKTTIKILAINSNEEENMRIVEFIKIILTENLTSVYEQNTFKLKKNNEDIGELKLTIEPQEKEIFISILKDYKDMEIEENISDECNNNKRNTEEIKTNHKNSLEIINKKLEKWKDTTDKNERKILHLSDLHFDENTNIQNELILLEKDFDSKLEIIDYIILSGDLSAKGKAKEFEIIAEFISKLIELCNIDAQKVILVAGNHDYSRDITHNAYCIKDFNENNFKDKIDFKINDKIYLKREVKKWNEKFKYFSEYLYETIYNQSFDIQNHVKVIQDEKIAFVMMNTSTNIDHFNPLKVTFDTNAFITAQQDINLQKDRKEDKIKFAVVHHPI